MFDLPSMLGEYLLPLLILVPLAVVLVFIARRQQKDEPWQQRPSLHGKGESSPRAPIAVPLQRLSPAPLAPAARAPAPVEPEGIEDTEPMPFAADEHPTPFAAPPSFTADTVPLPLDEATPTDSLPRSPYSGGGSLPLLIVDDSAVVRAKLSKVLTAAGYAVSTARHGVDALEQLERHWFAVMITDLEMPEMDGFELIAKVSGDRRTQLLPIIAITGHEELQAKVQDARGLYGIFKKPWDDRELLMRVGTLALLRPRSGG
jgi:CheY-like chemotaxis protein